MPRPALIALALLASPVVAQQRDPGPVQDGYAVDDQPPPPPAPVTTTPTRTAETGTGRVGQRQTRREAAPGTTPLDRIDSRIANRVQSRIRNRIDRYYDPEANAADPFTVAGDQARTAGTQPR